MAGVTGDLTEGRLKLFVTACLARLTRNEQFFFRRASYVGLRVVGDREDNVVTFARSLGTLMAVVAVGRLFMTAPANEQFTIRHEKWGGTRILLDTNTPSTEFTDVLSGNRVKVKNSVDGPFISVADTLSSLPVAVLIAGA